jgi:NADH-quinone oxidoreductase subunit J
VDIAFYFFAALTLLGGLLTVTSRNAVAGALCMIVSFVGVAAIFVLLDAFFLAILQILVYAGAVMVLFLFIIMLLDIEGTGPSPKKISLIAGLVALALLVSGMLTLFAPDATVEGWSVAAPEVTELPTAEQPMAYTTSVRSYGYGLFTKYMLPFQITGFLLLIAMVGVIILSQRHAAAPTTRPLA